MENAEKTVRPGFRGLIKCVRSGGLPETFHGKPLALELLDEMCDLDIDPCDENGEYHTVVVGGPLLHHPVEVQNDRILRLKHISAIDLRLINR